MGLQNGWQLNVKGKFLRLLKNPILFFTATKYLSFGLLFVRGLLLADILGPSLFGVWGIVTMLIQYLYLSSLGIPSSAITELSLVNLSRSDTVKSIINNSTLIMIVVAGIMLLFGVLNLEMDLFGLDGVENNKLLIFGVFLVAVLQNFQQLFSSIYRVYNRLYTVAVSELLIGLLTIAPILFLEESQLLVGLLVGWSCALIIGNLLFLWRSPVAIGFSVEVSRLRSLAKLGTQLLVNNFSFYLILLSTKSLVAIYYTREIMGYYTLANNITNAALLGLKTSVWIMFPTLIRKLNTNPGDGSTNLLIHKITDQYSTLVFACIYLMILGLPAVFAFLPEYDAAFETLSVLLIAQGVLSTGLAVEKFLLAKKKPKYLAVASIAGLVIAAASTLAVCVMTLPLIYVAYAVLLGYLTYVFVLIRFANRILTIKIKFFRVLRLRSMFIILLIAFGMHTDQALLFIFISLALFIFTHKSQMGEIATSIKNILRNQGKEELEHLGR